RAGPDGGMAVAGGGDVRARAGRERRRGPRVRGGVVPPARVQRHARVVTAPDDHLRAGPDGGMAGADGGDVRAGAGGERGRDPRVRGGIVPPARIEWIVAAAVD